MRISDWSSDVCSSDLPRRSAPTSGYSSRHHLRAAIAQRAVLCHLGQQPPAAAAVVIIGVRHRHIIALPPCRDDEHLGKALSIERQYGHRYLGYEASPDHLRTPLRLHTPCTPSASTHPHR